jgi:hypothetical protein
LLGLSRSSLYYEPAAETAKNLRLMRLLDEEYTAHPFLGSRRLTKWLIEQGYLPVAVRRGAAAPEGTRTIDRAQPQSDPLINYRRCS